jgi:hypothetical protein
VIFRVLTATNVNVLVIRDIASFSWVGIDRVLKVLYRF